MAPQKEIKTRKHKKPCWWNK